MADAQEQRESSIEKTGVSITNEKTFRGKIEKVKDKAKRFMTSDEEAFKSEKEAMEEAFMIREKAKEKALKLKEEAFIAIIRDDARRMGMTDQQIQAKILDVQGRVESYCLDHIFPPSQCFLPRP